MDVKGGTFRISEENLRIAVLEQRSKGPGFCKEERLEFSEVQELDLISRHISKIMRLWEFTSLKTLNLNNNSIKKIEGLSRLTNLISLNLSFNNIEKLEGLESLEKLEELNLSDNRISVLENMDSLEKLVAFNIANNHLKQLDQVMYLRMFKKLSTLNLSGNPLSEQDDYKFFITAFFPKLKYLDYRYLNMDIKKEAGAKYHIQLQQLHLQELEETKKAEALKAKQEEQQLHADAFVELLNGSSLFEQMFKDDPQANQLQSVPEIAAQLKTFKQKITERCVQLFETGLAEHKQRQAEVNSFNTSYNKTTADTRQREAQLIEEFQHHFQGMKKESDPSSQTLKACTDELNQLQKSLLTEELKLIREIEMMTKKLDTVITEMVATFSETAQEIFAQCRELEDHNDAKVQEIATTILENVAKHHRVEDLSEDVKMLFLDKDVVMNALKTAHENHLVTLRDRESQLTARANAWKTRLIKKLEEKELLRNMMALSHINTYVDHYRQEVDRLFNR